MNRRGTGTVLIGLGVLAYCSKYLTAAIFGSGVASWNAALFRAMLQYVGTPLSTMGNVLFAAGVLYLVWGEFSSSR